MLCCPLRSARNASKLFPGGTFNSDRSTTESNWSSFLRTMPHNRIGQALRAALVFRPLKRSSVALSAVFYLSQHNDKLSCRAEHGSTCRIVTETWSGGGGQPAVNSSAMLHSAINQSVQQRRGCHAAIQFSMWSPATRRNSRSLLVTSISCCDNACAASSRSIAPIGQPLLSNEARTLP